MPAGLLIINDDSFVQIDSTYANYALVARGTGTLTNGNSEWAPGSQAPVAPTIKGVNPLIAFSCETYLRVSRSQSGDTFRFFFTSDDSEAFGHSKVVNWYIFDTPPSAASQSGIGLQVWNEQGIPVFDSSLYYLKVIDFVFRTARFPFVGATTESLVYPGKKIAVVACQQAININLEGSGGTDAFTLTTLTPSVKDPVLTLKDGTGYYSIGGATGGTQPLAVFLVIDVTDIPM